MVSSELFGFTLNFFITVVIARYLGVIGFGHYSFVFAFVGFFQMIADSGLSNIMIREVAVNRNRLKYQFGVTKSLIWVLSIIVLLMIIIIINLLPVDPAIKTTTYIMGVAVLATVHALGYNAIFRAMEDMEYNAIGFVLHKVLLLSLIVLVILLRKGLAEIAISYLIANLALWFFYYQLAGAKYLRTRMIIDVQAWRYFISEALPVGIASILRKISWQVDILILTAIGTAASAGLFSAPYKIIQSMNLLSHTLSLTLFPYFARLGKNSSGELFLAYEKSLKFMYILGVPIVVVLAAYARSIMTVLFGQKFSDAYLALQILSLTVLFLFPTAQFIYLFSALGLQRLYTISSVLSLAINVVLDFALIPVFDFIGACVATLIAEAALFLIGIYYAKSLDKNISFSRALWKPAVSGMAMWAVLSFFSGLAPVWMFFGALAGCAAYLLLLFMLKTFSAGEFAAIKESIRFMKKGPVPPVAENNLKG